MQDIATGYSYKLQKLYSLHKKFGPLQNVSTSLSNCLMAIHISWDPRFLVNYVVSYMHSNVVVVHVID